MLTQLSSGDLFMIGEYNLLDEYPSCVQEAMKEKKFTFSGYKLYKIAEFGNRDKAYNEYNVGSNRCAILEVNEEGNEAAYGKGKGAGVFYIIINVMGIKEIR